MTYFSDSQAVRLRIPEPDLKRIKSGFIDTYVLDECVEVCVTSGSFRGLSHAMIRISVDSERRAGETAMMRTAQVWTDSL